MVTTITVEPTPDAGDVAPRGLPLRGALQVVALLWIYVAYAGLRNLATGSPAAAANHAAQILRVERAVGIGFGQSLRDATHDVSWLVSLANLVYATHAVVPVVVLVLLYRKLPDRYRQWRDTFAVVLALGLIGYWLYPVMPPRILATSYRFVDTAQRLSIGRAPLPGAVVPDPNHYDVFGFSNPYASMPSLHVAWALLSTMAAWSLVRRWWSKALLALYPVLMALAVTITWNHWTLDSVAGAATVLVAYAIVRPVTRVRRHADPNGPTSCNLVVN